MDALVVRVTTPMLFPVVTNREPYASSASLSLPAILGLGLRIAFSTSLIVFFDTSAASPSCACDSPSCFLAAWKSTEGSTRSFGKSFNLSIEVGTDTPLVDWKKIISVM